MSGTPGQNDRRGALRRLRAFLGDQSGSPAIEFALVAPVFMLFALGLVEFGRALWTNNALQMAADQAGRFAIANPLATDEQLQNYAVSKLVSVDTDHASIIIDRQTVSGVAFVTIEATYPFTSFGSLLPLGPLTLIGRSRVPLT